MPRSPIRKGFGLRAGQRARQYVEAAVPMHFYASDMEAGALDRLDHAVDVRLPKRDAAQLMHHLNPPRAYRAATAAGAHGN